MKKSNRWIALFTILAMSALLMSSCAGGLTYEDVAGNSSAVDVPARDQLVNVPYTGDPIVEIIEIEGDVIEVTKEDENQGGGESQGGSTEGSGDDAQGGGDNQGDSDNAQGGGDTDDEEIVWEDTGIPEHDEEAVIRILDQNVRCVSDVKEGYAGTSREERHLRLLDQVEKTDPDVMGFQEVVPAWMKFLVADYSDEYDYYNCYRYSGAATGQDEGDECSPVFWKKDRFDMVETGHFWLSETPEKPSKFGNQTDQNRICNWVKLKDKVTGKQLVFGSVHYSLDPNARLKSASVMNTYLKKAANSGKLPIVCVGDYNMAYNSEEYTQLSMGGVLTDINVELNSFFFDREFDWHSTGSGYKTSSNLFNENGEVIGAASGIIDFVMISYESTGLYPLHYEVLQKKYGGSHISDGYVSDHFGLYAEVVII